MGGETVAHCNFIPPLGPSRGNFFNTEFKIYMPDVPPPRSVGSSHLIPFPPSFPPHKLVLLDDRELPVFFRDRFFSPSAAFLTPYFFPLRKRGVLPHYPRQPHTKLYPN